VEGKASLPFKPIFAIVAHARIREAAITQELAKSGIRCNELPDDLAIQKK